jgi:hypothetical protein
MDEDLKPFTFAFTARQKSGPAMETGIGTGVLLAKSEQDAEEAATTTAFEVYPIGDGWEDHEIIVQFIEQGMGFDTGHHLMWRLEKTP